MGNAGERFARAVAARDGEALRAVLADSVDFQALTPGRHWQAATPGEIADEIIFGRWFAGADVKELCWVTTGEVAGREHVAYRLRVARGGRDHLLEQQAYYDIVGGRIAWVRILCSGYQALPEEPLAAT
jgi:hypothetical protein